MMAATALADVPAAIAQLKIQWRMSTAWPPALDMLQEAAQRLANVVAEMTGGRFRIEVSPGGQIMSPLDCFDATSRGTIEAFMGASYYRPEKEPAVQWFSTIPFGLTEFHVKNAIALETLGTEFKDTVEIIQLPLPVLRDLKKIAAVVVREEAEKTPMGRKVHASFTKFQARLTRWDQLAEGAYHQLVAR